MRGHGERLPTLEKTTPPFSYPRDLVTFVGLFVEFPNVRVHCDFTHDSITNSDTCRQVDNGLVIYALVDDVFPKKPAGHQYRMNAVESRQRPLSQTPPQRIADQQRTSQHSGSNSHAQKQCEVGP